jgi:putative membrane protein
MLVYYIKAIHIIFVVTWFAGLFYLPRLFIYQTEANQKNEPDRSILIAQFKIMSKRLWFGITWPSMIITFIMGFWMAYQASQTYLTNIWIQPWFILKLAFVFGLLFYHLSLGTIYRLLQKDVYKYSSFKLRIWNEVATLFLIAIVFIVVLKDTLNFLWGILGLVVLTALILLAIRIYKNFRKN